MNWMTMTDPVTSGRPPQILTEICKSLKSRPLKRVHRGFVGRAVCPSAWWWHAWREWRTSWCLQTDPPSRPRLLPANITEKKTFNTASLLQHTKHHKEELVSESTIYEGKSISKLQIVTEKRRMWITTYKQHLFFNVISIQI